jgi:redox-sensitive bicupin YhaK (pirin superfamily)
MSGPVEDFTETAAGLGMSAIEVREGREAKIGETRILRVLPTKRRRTVGPWCFVDLMAPEDLENPPPLEIGPHPHIGLTTVTWLFGGEVLHSDSLGSQQLIRPGQLNLMTAGFGIAHAEEGITPGVGDDTGGTLGVQMWLAQPDQTRNGGSRFQHIDELPIAEFTGGYAGVLVGDFAGAASPAEVDHPTVGLDITLRGPAELDLDRDFEHAVVPVDRPLLVGDVIVEPGSRAG